MNIDQRFEAFVDSSAESIATLDPSRLRDLLYSMKRLRFVEESIAAKYSEQKMRCPVHLSTGQEAVSSAAGLALRKSDLAVSGHRAHGHYIGKGGSVERMLAEIYGKVTGCSRGKGGSMHLIDESVGFMGSTAIVGGTIPVGVGLGLAMQVKAGSAEAIPGQIACVFLGDGAVEEGAFYEAANFAAVRKLPVLFLCENNLYSVYSPLKPRQPEGRRIAEMVRALGIPSESGDGNDAATTLLKIDQAVERIRSGQGPQFLEFFAYRWREHCGPNFDNHIGYRTEEEYAFWRAREPVARLEQSLLERGIVNEVWLDEADRLISEETAKAFAFAETSPFPEAHDAYTDVYFSNDSVWQQPEGMAQSHRLNPSYTAPQIPASSNAVVRVGRTGAAVESGVMAGGPA